MSDHAKSPSGLPRATPGAPARYGPVSRYAFGAAAVAAAFYLRWLLIPLLGNSTPYLTIYPVAMIVAATMGMRVGCVAFGLGAVLAELWITDAPGPASITWPDISRVAILYAAIIYLGRLGENLRAARQRAEEEASAARAAAEALRRHAELIDPVRAELIAQEMQRVVRERGAAVAAPPSKPAGDTLRRVPVVAGAIVAGVGLLVFIGWMSWIGHLQERPARPRDDEGQHRTLFPAGGRGPAPAPARRCSGGLRPPK